MNKIFLLILMTTFSLLQAKMVDGIALVVEGEPITTAEIRAIRTQMGVSKKKATELLIQDRLQKSAFRGVKIDETLVDSKIADIAKQNRLSVPKMQTILKQQGTTWTRYRTSIRDALKQEKFYRDTVASNTPSPSEDELKEIYNKHKSSFTLPSRINVVEYSAKTEKELQHFMKTKKQKGIKSRSLKKSTKGLEPDMLTTFLQTKNGNYTPTFNAGDKYITYKVHSKTGKSIMPFNVARPAVEARWRASQQDSAIKDYFEKLRTKADIQILR